MNRSYHKSVCDYIELVATAVVNRCDQYAEAEIMTAVTRVSDP